MHGVVSKRSHIWEFALQIHVFSSINMMFLPGQLTRATFSEAAAAATTRKKKESQTTLNLFHSLDIVMRSR
jgi:ATP/ADP translocase